MRLRWDAMGSIGRHKEGKLTRDRISEGFACLCIDDICVMWCGKNVGRNFEFERRGDEVNAEARASLKF
jgi:hypothetical protein